MFRTPFLVAFFSSFFVGCAALAEAPTSLVAGHRDQVARFIVLDLAGRGIDVGKYSTETVEMDIDGDNYLENLSEIGANAGVLHKAGACGLLILQYDKFHFGGFRDKIGPGGTFSVLDNFTAYFDDNHDGIINADDHNFGELRIWNDRNRNGKCSKSEISKLDDHEISSISLDFEAPTNLFLHKRANYVSSVHVDSPVNQNAKIHIVDIIAEEDGLKRRTAGRIKTIRYEGSSFPDYYLVWDRSEPLKFKLDQSKISSTYYGFHDSEIRWEFLGATGRGWPDIISAKGMTEDVTIFGKGGADKITGGGRHDILYGGHGNDIIIGRNGEDLITGGKGDDSLYGDNFAEVVFYDQQEHSDETTEQTYRFKKTDDSIFGEQGDDYIYAGMGNDGINGGPGDDQIFAGSGNDTLVGGGGADLLVGGTGSDIIYGAYQISLKTDWVDAAKDGADRIYGGDGNDWVDGGLGNDQIYGQAGRDEIHGADGSDTIRGGVGDDYLSGGRGNDIIYGDAGADKIATGAGIDYVEAGPGADEVEIGVGENYVFGGEGDDILNASVGGKGKIDGGAGNDEYVFDWGAGGYEITDVSGENIAHIFTNLAPEKIKLTVEGNNLRIQADADSDKYFIFKDHLNKSQITILLHFPDGSRREITKTKVQLQLS